MIAPIALLLVLGADAQKPDPLAFSWSVVRCYHERVRDAATEEVRTEQRYARELGGVVDIAKLYRLQQVVRRADDGIDRVDRELRQRGLKRLTCQAMNVEALAVCIQGAHGAALTKEAEAFCAEAKAVSALASVYSLSPELRPR